MSSWLYYSTRGPVSPQVRQQILAETERLRTEHDWWDGPIIFFEVRLPGQVGDDLQGGTQMMLTDWTTDSGEHVEVEDSDDAYRMMGRDAKLILEQLRSWSERFGLSWMVEMADTEYGEIAGGVIPPAMFEAFRKDGIDVASPVDEEQARRISQKYASRRSGRFDPDAAEPGTPL
jgi:hypothetical protein